MTYLKRIKKWLRLDADTKTPDETLSELLIIAKQAKYAEEYDRAQTLFAQAIALADGLGDTSAKIIITLHQADILIALGRYDEAAQLLTAMRDRAERANQRTQLAYALCSLGQLAQIRGDWERAREYYEKARRIAQLAHALGAEGRAEGHLADTYLQEGNASYAIHLLREALPRLEASGDIEMGSYFVGRLGEALIASGREQEGAQLLIRALTLAQKMPSRLYSRQWHLAFGSYALKKQNYLAAKDHYEAALALFSPPRGLLYAQTLLATSQAAYGIGDTNTALTRVQVALAHAQTLDNPQLLAQCKMWLGLALQADKRPEEALPYLLEAANEDIISAPTDRIRILRALAAAHQAIGADEQAINAYQSALALAVDDNDAKAQTLIGLGYLYRQRREYTLALQAWSQAIDAYQSSNNVIQIVRLYCDIAEARAAIGQRRRAIKDYESALMRLHEVTDIQTRGVVLANAAVAYVEEGDTDSAESFFREAIDIAQQLGDKTIEAQRRNNYGYFLLQIGELHPASIALNDALDLCRQQGQTLLEAIILGNIGQLYLARGDLQRAQQYTRQALDIAQTVGQIRWIAHIQIQLAKILLIYNGALEALPLLEEALAIGRSQRDIDITISALIGAAQATYSLKALDKAMVYIDEAVQIASRSESRRLLADALATRSQLEQARGEHERARATWTEANKLYQILRIAIKEPLWLAELKA